jgi:hypothetical protein
MGHTLEARPGAAGLSRYAPLEGHYDEAFLARGLARPNSSQLGGGKDTWLLA